MRLAREKATVASRSFAAREGAAETTVVLALGCGALLALLTAAACMRSKQVVEAAEASAATERSRGQLHMGLDGVLREPKRTMAPARACVYG